MTMPSAEPRRPPQQEPAVACEDPVFVLCAGRSGSTLVRFLLDAHPDLACPPETRLPWLCTQLATAWSVIEGVSLPSGDAGELRTVPDPVVAGLRQSLYPMVGSYLARRGKKRYCDKSLGGAQHAGLLQQVWPEARFVCLYRHPMDVIGSGIEACPWGLSGYGFESYVPDSSGNIVSALARYWADYTAAIVVAEEQLGASCLRLRYEDLVADPEAEAARLFGFAGAKPVPGIADSCFSPDLQRFGPGDYKIWNTSQVTADSVGRGWPVPVRLIPAQLLARVNELADKLGYLPVDEKWGTGSRPADFRVPAGRRPAAARPAAAARAQAGSGAARATAGNGAARATAGSGAADASSGTVLVSECVQAGLRRLDAQFARSWGHCSAESVLLFATVPGQGADAWWRLDLGAGTVTAGAGDRAADADWTVTGSAQAWQQVLSGGINLGVAFRRGELRYADKGDAGAGSPVADNRVAMMAELLGVISWQPASADGPSTRPSTS
jgi:hypothetical protein